jgi:RecJ-like exonuclease
MSKDDDVLRLSKKAAGVISSLQGSTRIRVVSHYDADGITAAAIICKALYREGYDFHATLMRNPFDKGLKRLMEEENELIIFLDMGSGQIETLEKIQCKVIIVDHHQYLKSKVREDIVQINANLCGIDGNYEASGSTLSFALATALDSNNEDLSPLALAGAIGDKQHIRGFRGFNKKVLENASKKDFVKEYIDIKLYGDSIYDAIYFSIDPYYKGLSGDADMVEKTLERLDINKHCVVEEVDEKDMKRLRSYLLFKLIKAGCRKDVLDAAVGSRFFSQVLGYELERFADILDACGKGGHRGLGIPICFRDKESFEEGKKIEKEYKQKILEGLEKIQTKDRKGFRYFYYDNSSLGGVVAGVAINYVLDDSKPLFSLVREKDEIHVSCRGTQGLVDRGLDLGGAMKKISADIGGHGGGHRIAAGATISSDKEEMFLNKVDEVLSSQI